MDDLAIGQNMVVGLSSEFAPDFLHIGKSMVQDLDLESFVDHLLMHEKLMLKTMNLMTLDPTVIQATWTGQRSPLILKIENVIIAMKFGTSQEIVQNVWREEDWRYWW